MVLRSGTDRCRTTRVPRTQVGVRAQPNLTRTLMSGSALTRRVSSSHVDRQSEMLVWSLLYCQPESQSEEVARWNSEMALPPDSTTTLTSFKSMRERPLGGSGTA